MNPLELTLGIMTAVGGFVDISELVFAAQAGSIFGYALIWAFAFSTVGMMVFGEMCGRVAAIAKQPVFNLMRHRLGLKLGLVTLFASLISTLITCAAEIGGMGLILHYLTGAPYLLMAVASALVLMASMWILPFKWIERTYGLLGLLMLSFAVALVAIRPPWDKIAGGFLPQVPSSLSVKELLTFAYFGVAILSAVLFPYEAYFYSSGGIEEGWGPKDLLTNRITTTVGFALGSLLAIVDPRDLGASCSGRRWSVRRFRARRARGRDPARQAGTARRAARHAVRGGGRSGRNLHGERLCHRAILRLGVGPAQEAVGSAPVHARLDHLLRCWRLPIVLTGVDVMSLVEYAVLFSIVVLPLTYLPLMLLAGDKSYMGQYANKWLANGLGWLYFAIVTIAAVAAIPLYLLTSGGQA